MIIKSGLNWKPFKIWTSYTYRKPERMGDIITIIGTYESMIFLLVNKPNRNKPKRGPYVKLAKRNNVAIILSLFK